MSRQFNIRVTEAKSGALFWLVVIIVLIGGSYLYTHRNTSSSDNIAALRRLVK